MSEIIRWTTITSDQEVDVYHQTRSRIVIDTIISTHCVWHHMYWPEEATFSIRSIRETIVYKWSNPVFGNLASKKDLLWCWDNWAYGQRSASWSAHTQALTNWSYDAQWNCQSGTLNWRAQHKSGVWDSSTMSATLQNSRFNCNSMASRLHQWRPFPSSTFNSSKNAINRRFET